MKPTGTKPAVQNSDADRKHKILITDKCTMTLTTWLEKGETLRRVDRYRYIMIEGRYLYQIMSAETPKVTKTKTALKQELETSSLSDLKHDLHCQCGFQVVELGDSVSVSQ